MSLLPPSYPPLLLLFPLCAAYLLYRGFSANSCHSHNAYEMAGRSVKLTKNLAKPQNNICGQLCSCIVVAQTRSTNQGIGADWVGLALNVHDIK